MLISENTMFPPGRKKDEEKDSRRQKAGKLHYKKKNAYNIA